METARKIQPDVAHFHNTWYAISPTVINKLKRAGVPSVVTVHNYRLMCANAQLLRDGEPCELCVGSTPWNGIRYRCYRDHIAPSIAAAVGIEAHRVLGTWANSVDRFLTPTHFLRNRLIAAGLPAERISVHSNFVPDPGERQTAPSASNRVVFLGRLSAQKGLLVALEAWRQASPPGLKLAVAGSGPLQSRISSTDSDSVELLGWLKGEDISTLLMNCRAVLFPSISHEVQGLGVLEAFAAGAPVMGSSTGGLGETIAPLGPEWSVAPGSVNAWRHALSRLGSDSFVDAGGRAGRRAYEQHHSPSLARSRLEETYAECANLQ
jgi:glycosyltransferase involved in cell wall biosynthesis